jgi:hypothetical protein
MIDDGPRSVGKDIKSICDRPKSVGGAMEEIGDRPRSVGGAMEEIGDRPRSVGGAMEEIGDRPRSPRKDIDVTIPRALLLEQVAVGDDELAHRAAGVGAAVDGPGHLNGLNGEATI